jgi:FKBP-type peptidyl-prolyl cis-trans isomerase
MNPTQTGIAVAVALVVIIFFFIFNGMSLFSKSATSQNAPVVASTTSTGSQPSQNASAGTAGQAVANATQLQVTDEVVGTGATAETGDTVTVQYVGSLANGTVFDASANHGTTGFTFKLGAGLVIKGWDEGVVGMKVGGKRKLVIPPSLGYGPQDYGPIPGNSTLTFEIELVKVQKAQ